MSEHTELPWRAIRNTGIRNDGGYVVFSKPKPCHYSGQDERYEREIKEWHGNLEFIALACNAFADIEEGVSLIVRKDHYYQLEAQAKSQPDLLEALQYVITVIKDDDSPWWMDCPDKGGFDVEKLETAIEKAAP